MALADLPGEFVTFSRDELIERSKRDYLLRNPSADVVSGQPDLDARMDADLVGPMYANARLIADGINEDAATGKRLELVGGRIGQPRGAATGASGYVAVTAGVGGFTAVTGDELENPKTKKKYQADETRSVQDGEHLRVRAKSKGPDTDVDPGITLRWTSPRPGSGDFVTVVEQSEGRGLSGGAEAQNDARYLDAIRSKKQNPPAGDNDAELIAVVLATPDVPIEQVFTYPGVYGPGTSAFTFTVLAPSLGASRLPTAAQVQAAYDWLEAQMPGDGSYFPLVPTAELIWLAFDVSWATGGWADPVPWPVEHDDVAIVSSATSPTAFVLATGTGPAPVVGNTIGLWDNPKRTFRRKRLATVSGSGPWTITCATANGASDTSYTPFSGQRVCPWSDNLNDVAPTVLAYMATLGPGELFDISAIPSVSAGRRRIRQPEAPKLWPYKTTNKLTTDLAGLDVIADATGATGIGSAVTAALPPRLWSLSDLSFFPQT